MSDRVYRPPAWLRAEHPAGMAATSNPDRQLLMEALSRSGLVFRDILIARGNFNNPRKLLCGSYVRFDLSNSQSSGTTASRLQPGANGSFQDRLEPSPQLNPPLS